MNTGDTRWLRSLSTSDCPCLTFAQTVEQDWKIGRVVAPNYYTITGISEPAINVDALTVVNVTYDRAAEASYDTAGRRTSYNPPKSGLKSVFLIRFRSGVWLVADVQRYPSP